MRLSVLSCPDDGAEEAQTENGISAFQVGADAGADVVGDRQTARCLLVAIDYHLNRLSL